MIVSEDCDDLSNHFETLFRPPRRRRSSMLDRWIKEQQIRPHPLSEHNSDLPGFDPTQPGSGTPPNAYLAYPDLVRHKAPTDPFDDASTVNSYDLVQDDDIPTHVVVEPTVSEAPTTPKTQRSPSFLPTPPSFRGFLSFRSSSSPAHSVSRSSNVTPLTPSRISVFPRQHDLDSLPPHNQHSRAASLSTINIPGQTASPQFLSPGMSKWRPSVMGHFGSPSSPVKPSSLSESTFTPSRPSMSSCNTYTSTSPTTIESDIQMSFNKLSLVDSIRSYGHSSSTIFKSGVTGTASSMSLSRPQTASGTTLSCNPKTETRPSRTPFAPKSKGRYGSNNLSNDARGDVSASDMTRPHVVYTSGSHRGPVSRIAFRDSKKKKLVASGVGPNETRKFEAFKRWCESFGEVHQITRMPNGELHVHFRDAEVAETVCRLRARVFIAGVGSVFLSWYTGNKR